MLRALGRASIFPTTFVFTLMTAARISWLLRDAEGALEPTEAALSVIEEYGERVFEGELLRLRGELLRASHEAAAEACFLEALEDGTVACWGDAAAGTLGVANLTNTSGLTPLPVAGLPAVKRISAYSFQTCAVLADGTVRHWGTDFNPGTGSLTPEAVPGLSSAVDVASGEFHDCALLVFDT